MWLPTVRNKPQTASRLAGTVQLSAKSNGSPRARRMAEAQVQGSARSRVAQTTFVQAHWVLGEGSKRKTGSQNQQSLFWAQFWSCLGGTKEDRSLTSSEHFPPSFPPFSASSRLVAPILLCYVNCQYSIKPHKIKSSDSVLMHSS